MTAEKVFAPRRRPATGGYARGEEQRQRIINAAIKVFAQEGYERASTRQIATEAGVTPPALQYYFDSKEGLNRACAELVVSQALEQLSGPLEAARRVSAEASREEALDALCSLLDALVDANLLSREAPEQSLFSARMHSEDSPASPILRERVSHPFLEICSKLVSQIIGEPVGDVVRLRASLIVAQATVFHVQRESTLAKLGWPDFDGPRRELAKAILRDHARGALTMAQPPSTAE